MKKWAIIGIIAAIIVGSAIVVSLVIQADKTAEDKATTADKIEKGKFNNACQVATKDAAGAVFGVTFAESKQDGGGITSNNSASNTCRYNEVIDGTPTGLMKAINLTIDVNTYPTTDGAKSALDATKKTEKIDDKIYFVRTDVPQVGDEAFFFQDQAPGVLKTQEYMYARKGNQVVHFIVTRIEGIDHEKTRAAITTLAKKALN